MAFEVPERHKASVVEAVAPLKAVVPGARWTAPQAWHVTLRFFGEVAEDRLPELRQGIGRALEREEVAQTSLQEVGAFPTMRRARVLWVGLDDDQRRLAGIAERVGSECGMEDDRPFHSHLTLARLKVPVSLESLVERFRPFLFDRDPFVVERVILYRSHTERSGARYETLGEWELSTGQQF